MQFLRLLQLTKVITRKVFFSEKDIHLVAFTCNKDETTFEHVTIDIFMNARRTIHFITCFKAEMLQKLILHSIKSLKRDKITKLCLWILEAHSCFILTP